MKFQFSIARLLMATAMVALTFGLARLMIEEDLSNNLPLVSLLSLDMGLIAFVAKKRADLYRILRSVFFVFCCMQIMFSIYLLFQDRPLRFEEFALSIFATVPTIFIIILFTWLIAKRKREASQQNELQNMPANLPKEPSSVSQSQR